MVKPEEDFYEWVNEDWLKNNPIPDDKSSYGTFTVLDEESMKNQREILDNLEPKTHHQRLLSKFWRKCDFQDNPNFLITYFNKIYQEIIKTDIEDEQSNIGFLLGKLHQKGMNPFFSFGASIDYDDSKRHIPSFYLGGLSMPDKDYYLSDKYLDKQESFKTYIEKLGMFFQQDFSAVYEIQKKLAEFHFSKIEKRDPYKQYHPLDLSEVTLIDPSLMEFLHSCGYLKKHQEQEQKINVDNPEAYKNIIPFLRSLPLDIFWSCVKFSFFKSYGIYYSKELDNLYFEYLTKPFSGLKILPDLWKRKLKLINGNLGELVGEEYCRKFFTEETKEKALEMISYIREAFEERIKVLDWMEDETKEKALEKLKTINAKIGYPDVIEDYSSLDFTGKEFIEILIKMNQWEWENELKEMYQPVDRRKWGMNPQMVNAYYHPLNCEIVFPAAILQPPFFGGDDEENFGGIGAVIAHELTHAFDDKGRQFDKDGNLKDWWNKRDEERFNVKLKVIVEQFNNETFFGENIKGELTSGENIADDGGVKIAYQALNKKLGEKMFEKIDGFTREQRFFMSWGKIWRNNIREEYAKTLINTDPHSPGKLRVNAILKNCNDFYNAFSINEEHPMFLEKSKRFNLW